MDPKKIPGFGKEQDQKAVPPRQENLYGGSLAGAVSDQRAEQLLAASRSKTPAEQETRLSNIVKDYLEDVVPGANDGLKKATNDLRAFPDPATQATYKERYDHLVSAPGTQKPLFADWLSDQRESLIQKLSDAEDYRVVAEHMDTAFREAGKNPEQAIARLEEKAAILNNEVAGLEQKGGNADRINVLRLQAKRLYHAANKLDDLIRNK